MAKLARGQQGPRRQQFLTLRVAQCLFGLAVGELFPRRTAWLLGLPRCRRPPPLTLFVIVRHRARVHFRRR